LNTVLQNLHPQSRIRKCARIVYVDTLALNMVDRPFRGVINIPLRRRSLATPFVAFDTIRAVLPNGMLHVALILGALQAKVFEFPLPLLYRWP